MEDDYTDIPKVQGADLDDNKLDIFRSFAASIIAEFSGKSANDILSLLEAPKSSEHGDIAIAIPKLRIKGNPTLIAKEWAEKFIPNKFIVGVFPISHYLNFKISKPLLTKIILEDVYKKKEKYGTNKSGVGKTAVLDYSSPNIAKPFHAGHLRSTIIGNFIKNVHNAHGWKTIGINYLGDWGKQYGLLAVGFEKYGSEQKLIDNPIKHLYDVYVKINADIKEDPSVDDQARSYFKKMEDDFDIYSGESQVKNESITQALSAMKEKNILEESDGALIADLKKYKSDIALIQKNDGTTLYITRDIGAAIERYEKYKFDVMYYVVASQQDLHFKQLFKLLELIGVEWANKCRHINFGIINGMSTRKGTAVFLDEILNQTKESMHEVMKQNENKYSQIDEPDKVADVIGISAVMIQDMSAKRIRNYSFDWSRMFSFEGDTGPYLQYAHARLCSIERNCGLTVNPSANIDLLSEEIASVLMEMVAQYPDVVKSALHTLEPCTVVTYAMKLSHTVSMALESLWVVGKEHELAEARLLMYWATRITLGNALKLLGLKPLERM
ncbi:15277_t:CDS:2 [Entrophospora sp. SA101]|nr:15277_t:CDS:2 [Entrophospora sp. SA101]